MRTQLLAVTAAVAASLALATTASATTFHSSPGATRTAAPCTQADPCKLGTALDLAFSGDEVPLAPGTYTHQAGDPLQVRPGVHVHGAPGRVRPLIEQAAPYRDCDGCPVLNVYGDAVLRDVDVRQVEGGGAVKVSSGATIERSSLRGRSVAITFIAGPAGAASGGVRDALAVADDGTAIVARGGTSTRYLENVTAIGHGGLGVAIRAESHAGVDETIDAVNTIARGDYLDVQATAGGNAGINDVATVKLRYSNFRADRIEKRESDPAWSNAQIETFDNNQHGDPQFVSATDFRLAQGSPAVDGGRTAGLFGTLDLDGSARIHGAKPDIGAYEWSPAPPAQDGGNQNPGSTPGQDQQQGPGEQQPEVPKPPEQPEIPKQPEKPAAGLAVAKQTITVKKNVAAVKVECPPAASAGCKGTLALRGGKVKAGSARYSLTPGKRGVVKVKLTKAARKLIARKRTLKVTATATAASTSAPITLKLAPRRR